MRIQSRSVYIWQSKQHPAQSIIVMKRQRRSPSHSSAQQQKLKATNKLILQSPRLCVSHLSWKTAWERAHITSLSLSSSRRMRRASAHPSASPFSAINLNGRASWNAAIQRTLRATRQPSDNPSIHCVERTGKMSTWGRELSRTQQPHCVHRCAHTLGERKRKRELSRAREIPWRVYTRL